MANVNTAPAQLPDPQTALNTLFTNISSEVFFGKLASAGFAPQSEKEASDLIDLAGRLRLIDSQIKVAATSPYAAMVSELDTAMAQAGMGGPVKQAASQERTIAIKRAAAQAAQNPEIYNAVLTIRAAQAAEQIT